MRPADVKPRASERDEGLVSRDLHAALVLLFPVHNLGIELSCFLGCPNGQKVFAVLSRLHAGGARGSAQEPSRQYPDCGLVNGPRCLC